MNRQSQTSRVVNLSLLLALATLATYWPVLHNNFLNYDDPDYVTANEVVQNGLTLEGAKWAFTTGHASNWHPVTWLSHMLDVSCFDLRPRGHHAISLFFHVANSVLVLLLLWQMTGAVWRSVTVAAFFALHPLHVESVAWVAERKDVLCAFFGLLTLIAYARYAQTEAPIAHSKKAWYSAALVLFALGLMSKPMLVTLPFVMLLLDVWPLNRLPLARSGFEFSTLKQLVSEKLPFVLLAIISSAITVVVQRGAMAKTEIVPMSHRSYNAILALTHYLQQTVWPAKLAVFYPFPINFPPLELAIAIGILLAIFAPCLRRAFHHPFLIIGWLWFLGMLIPVIGLVQVGSQARADRYTYLPLLGICVAISWSLGTLVGQRRQLKGVIYAAVAAVLVTLSIVSHAQLKYWRDDRTLWSHAAGVTTGNYMAWGGLGIAAVEAANWASAITDLTRACEYAKPHHTERAISYYLGVALQMEGKPLKALPYLEDSFVSAELRPERDHRLGLSLIEAGRLTEAEAALRSAFTAKPNNLNYQLGLAALYVATGDLTTAEATHRAAIAAHPIAPLAAKAYADFLKSTNRSLEAEVQYAKAVNLKPMDPAYRKAYADALRRAGEFESAAAQFEAAFKITQPTTQELLDLAEIYYQAGQPQSVIKCYDRALNQEPNSVAVLNNFAWFLATSSDEGVRDGKRAVVLAEQACAITEGKSAILMGTLAAAYAEAGRFLDAVAMADRAIAKARDDRLDEVATRNAELRELYSKGKPWRSK